jgi:hypothetical protein
MIYGLHYPGYGLFFKLLFKLTILYAPAWQIFIEVVFDAEYGMSETTSTKGDFYNYGILLLEMFTRKRSTSDMFIRDLNLHKWVNLEFPNKVKEVIDINLLNALDVGEFEENKAHNCLLSLLQVGFLC